MIAKGKERKLLLEITFICALFEVEKRAIRRSIWGENICRRFPLVMVGVILSRERKRLHVYNHAQSLDFCFESFISHVFWMIFWRWCWKFNETASKIKVIQKVTIISSSNWSTRQSISRWWFLEGNLSNNERFDLNFIMHYITVQCFLLNTIKLTNIIWAKVQKDHATMNFEGEKLLHTVDYLFNAQNLINAHLFITRFWFKARNMPGT